MATTTNNGNAKGAGSTPTKGARLAKLAGQIDQAVVVIALGGAALSLLKGDLLGLVGCLAVAGYFSYRTSRRAATLFTALWNRFIPWKIGKGADDRNDRPTNGKRPNGAR